MELPLLQQGVLKPPEGFDEMLVKILQFLSTIANWIGDLIAALIHSILPSVTIPSDLAETIGLLAIVTIFLVIVQITKKLAWVVVIIGWVLVLVRVMLITLQG